MKTKLLLLMMIIFTAGKAQTNMHWRAVYQYKRILDEKKKARRDSLIKAQPAMADMIKKLYKRFDNRTFYLDFNTNESVYKEKAKLDKPGSGMSFLSNNDRLLYKNLKNGTYSEIKPFMQKTYLIVDSLPDYHWKVLGETKQIGQYTVIKAEGIEKSKKVKKDALKKSDKIEYETVEKKIIAWFSPELPIKNGPGKFWGLPGLIMEINKDGEVYLLKELIVNPKKYNEIKKPEKGQKVNQKEYRDIMKKEREKMRKMYQNRRNDKGSKTIRITM